jgi:hypothetical protein
MERIGENTIYGLNNEEYEKIKLGFNQTLRQVAIKVNKSDTQIFTQKHKE